MHNNFSMTACGFNESNSDILTINPNLNNILFGNIPKTFEITRLSRTALDIRILSSNANDPILKFGVDRDFGSPLTFSAQDIQTFRYITPSTVNNRVLVKTLCIDQTISNTGYFEINIKVNGTVSGFLLEGDKYNLRIGSRANGFLIGDVTITRTQSPVFVLPPILPII